MKYTLVYQAKTQTNMNSPEFNDVIIIQLPCTHKHIYNIIIYI